MNHETDTKVDTRITVEDLMIMKRAMLANDARRGVVLAGMMRQHAMDCIITQRWFVDRWDGFTLTERVALDMKYSIYGYESPEDLICPAKRQLPFQNRMHPRPWI